MEKNTVIKYGSEDLQLFKKIIEERLEKSRHQHSALKDSLRYSNSNGTDDTSALIRGYEDAGQSSDREYAAQQMYRMDKFIHDLEAALIRIANGTYGICRKTGKLIAKGRLMQVPHTTLSIAAKKKSND